MTAAGSFAYRQSSVDRDRDSLSDGLEPMSKNIVACLIWLAFPAIAVADFPIPLPFNRLVRDSTVIVRCTVVRTTPLVPDDDKKVPADASDSYLGPQTFTLIRVKEVWKNHPSETNADDLDSPDVSQEYLTVCHGYSRWGLRGISHDLTESRNYVLFLTKLDSGLYKLTDCNSAYTIADGKVPKMGVNLNEADVAKSTPVPTAEFKARISKELDRQAQIKRSEKAAER